VDANFRVLVTGSRDYADRQRVRSELEKLLVYAANGLPSRITVVHGGATGADTLADEEAKKLGYLTEPYPITKEEWRPPHLHGALDRMAGPRRNAQMIATGIDLCLAFPQGESRGTRGCMKLAEAAAILVINCSEKPLTN